jgi:hypothetical protein
MTDDGMANVRAVIEAAVSQWMPFIQIIDVDRKFDEDRNSMSLTIGFTAIIDPTNASSITLVF